MLEELTHICNCLAYLLNIPIRIYSDDTLIESFDPFFHILDIDLTLPYLEQLYDANKNINYCITSNLLIMGIVKNETSNYSTSYYVIIGPSCVGGKEDHIAKDLITSGLYPLKLDQTEQLHKYLKRISHIDIVKFTNLLSALNTIINHDVVETKNILTTEAEYEVEKEVEYSMLKKDKETSFEGYERRNPYDNESEMLFCIKNGLTSRLQKLPLNSNIEEIGVLGLDITRHAKNSAIILNSLSLRAAIAGGLNPETSYQLGEIYIHKIEACKTQNDLNAICQSILFDYCKRVEELQYPSFDDPLINKATHYIDENIDKKITAEEIAAMLAISKEYLSKRFKEVTKTTIPNYINRQKTLEAKRLLRFTDKPLSEISEYLSYSSQSYFQKMFKKCAGMTPLEYRKSEG